MLLDRSDAQLVQDVLQQASVLSDEASNRWTGGNDLDHRAHLLLGRMAALLPEGAVRLSNWPHYRDTPPAYTRDEHDLRAIMSTLPAGWRIDLKAVPRVGRVNWEATLHAPDNSTTRFLARRMNTAALRGLLAAVAGLLLEPQQAAPA